MYSSVAHTVCLGVGVGGVARGPAEFFGNSFNFDSTWYDAGLPCHCFLVAQVVHSLHLLLLPSFFSFFSFFLSVSLHLHDVHIPPRMGFLPSNVSSSHQSFHGTSVEPLVALSKEVSTVTNSQ